MPIKKGAVSATQRDQAITEAEVAKAALQAAEAQVESDRKAIAAAEAAILQAEAARRDGPYQSELYEDHSTYLRKNR